MRLYGYGWRDQRYEVAAVILEVLMQMLLVQYWLDLHQTDHRQLSFSCSRYALASRTHHRQHWQRKLGFGITVDHAQRHLDSAEQRTEDIRQEHEEVVRHHRVADPETAVDQVDDAHRLRQRRGRLGAQHALDGGERRREHRDTADDCHDPDDGVDLVIGFVRDMRRGEHDVDGEERQYHGASSKEFVHARAVGGPPVEHADEGRTREQPEDRNDEQREDVVDEVRVRHQRVAEHEEQHDRQHADVARGAVPVHAVEVRQRGDAHGNGREDRQHREDLVYRGHRHDRE